MKLTLDEIAMMDEGSPLDLFRQGIRAEKTREKYTRMLRKIVCDIMEDVLKGDDFEKRLAYLIRHGKEQPDWTLRVLLKLSEKLRARTELPKDHTDYLNPASIPNYFKPLKKLFDMCDVTIPWKRVYATYPELDNVAESRGWTREEIVKMLRHARDPMDRALVLVLSSSGVRAGGLDLAWGDVTPIYLVDGRLALDPGPGDHKIACAALRVYRGSPECYTTFITPEAHRALQEYGRDTWRDLRGLEASPSDPVFIRSKGAPVQASEKLLEKRIRRMVTQARLHDRNGGQVRRHKVPLMNGFRRFFNKVGKEALSHDSPLAALIKKEYMMGHQGTTPLDQNYFKTDVLELAAEYVNVVPELTIDDSERLKRSTRRMAENIQRMENEKDAKIERLEGQVRSMEEKMSKIVDLGGSRAAEILKAILASKTGGVPADALDSFTDMMRHLGAVQEDEMRKMRAEYDAKIDGLERTIERMAKGKNAGSGRAGGSGEDNAGDGKGDAADGDMRGPGPHHRDPF